MADRRRKTPKRVVLKPAQVRTIEDEIERLIAILDLVAPDPDLEDTGDLEPSLGSYSGRYVDGELDASDDEPSLGSLDRAVDQNRWSECKAYNAGEDLELDRSDYEDGGDTEENGDERDEDRDGEPSLGAPENGEGSQVGWAAGGHHDEEDCREMGARIQEIIAKQRASKRAVGPIGEG